MTRAVYMLPSVDLLPSVDRGEVERRLDAYTEAMREYSGGG